MNKITNLILLVLALAVLMAVVLGIMRKSGGDTVQNHSGKIRVLTTFFPLYDFTRTIAQDKIELTTLFTQTPEVSSFSPQDIQKINNADVLIKNGIGLEPILDDLIKSSDNKNIAVVDTSQGISILQSNEKENEAGNPHIWLDPHNAIRQVETIRDALKKADPTNALFYEQNAEKYIQQLRELDKDIEKGLSPLVHKDFVAFHSAFGYFAKRYGLHQAAVIEEFPGKEPSSAYLAEVIATIKRLGVKAIFSEPQFSPKVVEVIANDLDLQVRVLNPLESGDTTKDSYLSLMRENLHTLEEALR